LLADTGVISAELRDAALSSKARFRDPERDSPPVSIDADESTSIVRARLSAMLGVPLYSLDRMDLTASSTLERGVQEAVGTALRELTDPGRAEEAGLIGERLLAGGDPRRVSYSLTLVERGEDANRVRIQTDNLNQPLDLNEGSKLELGSTAKLRTLATYLEIVVELHGRLAGLKPEELRGLDIDRRDNLTRWAADYLRQAEDTGLAPMLEAAMQRRYSAHPGEAFFTGGGLHTFENFKREDDPRRPTVYEALRDSINLAFIRMMRDIVRYYVYQPGSTTRVLEDPELRASYLAQFAEREGKVFVQRFYRKYRDKPPEAVLPSLLAGVRPTAERLAVVFRAIEPDAGFDRFREFVLDHLNERTGGALPADSRLMHLYDRHAPGRFSLADQGYLARVHPLELWLAGYLRSHPGASLAEVIEASRAERQVVYGWLFKTRHRAAQDRRIQSLLEIEAFLEIHRQWKRLGYPFEQLVPSYATAIGSSGDRPAALAELMGIILNDGRRLPMVRVESLRFGGETPYETRMRHVTSRPEQVMAPEVAATLRRALTQVVSAGTARRLHGAFDRTDGPRIAIGGKTGTGDNRIESYGPGGRVIASRVLNRTATFVFFVGDRHFGTLTAFVAGREADAYQFTSALPVQILKALAPQLASFLDPRRPARCAPADRAVIAHIRQEHATSAR
jgi:membrane peptidoglycan carboxypeptidase